MIISTPREDDQDPHVAAMYAHDLEADGFVFSHTRAMAVNPEAHAAFEALVRAVVPSIGLRVYELATLAAAAAIGSAHCLLAHGRKTLDAGILDEEALALALRDPESAGLDERDVAVMAFAARLSQDAASMTDEDSARLRAVGFSDRQIVDIALAAGARNHFSRTLQALAVPIEDVPRLSPGLSQTLREVAAERGA